MKNGPTPTDALLRAVLESPRGIVIFALDRAYRYLAFNENHARTMAAIWNVEIEIGGSMLEYIGREDDRIKAKANFDRALSGEHFTTVETYGDERLDRRHFEDVYSPIVDSQNGTVIGLTLFLTDITEQRRAQEELEAYRHRLEQLVDDRTHELEQAHAQLLHAQKLESLGVMAAGLAHDFNNLLVGMLGCAELALADMPEPTAGRAMVQQIELAATQAASLTQQLLAYAGQVPPEVGPVDLHEVVTATSPLLRASIPRNVTLDAMNAGATPVHADRSQLQQVLTNLVLNAAESIGDERPGRITVTTEGREVDRHTLGQAFVDDNLPVGSYVALRVSDDGPGIDPDTRSRLFDPFFTTKFTGRGLGLATVLGIVRNHRGAVLVESTPGEGATFEVLLPVASDGLVASVEAAHEVPDTSGGAVLIVDDEAQVRMVAAEVLSRMGFDVLEAADGEVGLEQLERHGSRIVAVLLDMTMPKLDGAAAFHRVRALRPDVSVVVISGWTREHRRLAFLAEEDGVTFLQKPFRLKELRAAMAGVARPGQGKKARTPK